MKLNVKGNWIASLIFGSCLIASAIYLKMNQYDPQVIDEGQNRFNFYHSLVLVMYGIGGVLLALWVGKDIFTKSISNRLIIFLCLLTVVFMYVCEKLFGDPNYQWPFF